MMYSIQVCFTDKMIAFKHLGRSEAGHCPWCCQSGHECGLGGGEIYLVSSTDTGINTIYYDKCPVTCHVSRGPGDNLIFYRSRLCGNQGSYHNIDIRHATNNKRDSGGAPGVVGKFLYHRSIEIKEIPNN